MGLLLQPDSSLPPPPPPPANVIYSQLGSRSDCNRLKNVNISFIRASISKPTLEGMCGYESWGRVLQPGQPL